MKFDSHSEPGSLPGGRLVRIGTVIDFLASPGSGMDWDAQISRFCFSLIVENRLQVYRDHILKKEVSRSPKRVKKSFFYAGP